MTIYQCLVLGSNRSAMILSFVHIWSKEIVQSQPEECSFSRITTLSSGLHHNMLTIMENWSTSFTNHIQPNGMGLMSAYLSCGQSWKLRKYSWITPSCPGATIRPSYLLSTWEQQTEEVLKIRLYFLLEALPCFPLLLFREYTLGSIRNLTGFLEC